MPRITHADFGGAGVGVLLFPIPTKTAWFFASFSCLHSDMVVFIDDWRFFTVMPAAFTFQPEGDYT
jgi:hypothetical protein